MSVMVFPEETGMGVGAISGEDAPPVNGSSTLLLLHRKKWQRKANFCQNWGILLLLTLAIRTPSSFGLWAPGFTSMPNSTLQFSALWPCIESYPISFPGSETISLGPSKLPAFLGLQIADNLSWDFKASITV
jgi:hypothetical protein